MKLSHPERFNIELATTVLNQVTVHPESHYQANVMNPCGTVGCIAGWTNQLYQGEDKGRYYEGMDVAGVRLGLTVREASRLFSGGNTEWEARHILRGHIRRAEAYWADVEREYARREERRQRKIDRAARKQLRAASTTVSLPTGIFSKVHGFFFEEKKDEIRH